MNETETGETIFHASGGSLSSLCNEKVAVAVNNEHFLPRES